MASAKEINDNIAQTNKAIRECLERCKVKPSPSRERLDRILKTESRFKAAASKAGAIYQEFLAPAFRGQLEHSEKVQALQAQAERVSQEFKREVEAVGRREEEYKTKRRQILEANDEAGLRFNDAERQKYLNDASQRQAELHKQIESLNLEIKRLQSLGTDIRKESERQREELLARPSLQMEEALQELLALLDEVGGLEKEIERENRIGEELRQIAKADFESKAEDFVTAEQFHRAQARRLFWTIVTMVIISGLVIYYLFIEIQIPTASLPGGPVAVVIEKIVLFGVGRLALLLFCAWTIKYLSELHRSHSEQSVIYRDRKAALGVAQNMLNASPELVQKQELLRTLAAGYLDFDQNAFRSRRTASAGGAEDVKRLKEVVDTVRPLFESLKEIVEKAK